MTNHHHRSIHRLVVVLAVGIALLTACSPSQPNQSQAPNVKIGVLSTSTRFDIDLNGFKAGLADLGYTEGKNVTYIYDGPVDTAEKRDAAAQKLVAEKVNLILAFGSLAAQTAKKAADGTNIPILFLPVIDPVKAGLVQSITAPGGNSTGVTVGADLYAKELEWLQKVSPKIKRIFVPYDSPNSPAVAFALAAMKEAAPKLGLDLVLREIKSADDVPTTLSEISTDVDAICLVPGSTFVTAKLDDFIKASMDHKLPLSSTVLEWIDKGALISYSIDDTQVGKQAARLGDKLLKGAKPADLPVETAEYYLGFNIKTAQAIGLTVSDDILRQATKLVR